MALLDQKAPDADTGPGPTRRGLSYAYPMTGVAMASIFISWIFSSIFAPHLVTTGGSADIGYTHQHIPLVAFSGWIWYVIAIAMVLPAAIRGIRVKVTDRVAWTVLGLVQAVSGWPSCSSASSSQLRLSALLRG